MRRTGRSSGARAVALVGATVAMLALVGCESSSAAVTIRTFQFKPSPLQVEAGTDVSWSNEDDIGHTVTSGSPGAPDALFDGPLDVAGATFAFTFRDSGTYRYFCSIHPSMLGEIRVG